MPGTCHEHVPDPPRGRRSDGAVRRRRRPSVPVARRRRVDLGVARGRSASERLPAVVLERASRCGVQVAGRDRRLRRSARGRAHLRGPGGPRRCRDHVPQHHRSDQHPRVPASTRCRRRRGDDGRGASRQPVALGPARRVARLRRMRLDRHVLGRRCRRRPRRNEQPEAARHHRREQRHRLAPADRRDRGGGPRARSRGAGRCRATRPPSAASGSRRLRCVEWPQDVRTLRGRRTDRSPLDLRRR